jgi:hypothetical protein
VALTWHFHTYNVDGEFSLCCLTPAISTFITNSSTTQRGENPAWLSDQSSVGGRAGGPLHAAVGVPHVTTEVLPAASDISFFLRGKRLEIP